MNIRPTLLILPRAYLTSLGSFPMRVCGVPAFYHPRRTMALVRLDHYHDHASHSDVDMKTKVLTRINKCVVE